MSPKGPPSFFRYSAEKWMLKISKGPSSSASGPILAGQFGSSFGTVEEKTSHFEVFLLFFSLVQDFWKFYDYWDSKRESWGFFSCLILA